MRGSLGDVGREREGLSARPERYPGTLSYFEIIVSEYLTIMLVYDIFVIRYYNSPKEAIK